MKAQLYDRKRYAFDEEDLFSHSHDPKLETKTFPWWKPVLYKDELFGEGWALQNHKGELFLFNKFYNHGPSGYFPLFIERLGEAQFYLMTPVFFVDWMRKVTYDRSVALWNEAEARFKAEFPEKKSAQIDKMCDAEVSKYFEFLKENGSMPG